MTALLFVDCETTGLALDDDIWEFAAIRREPDGTESEHHLFIAHDANKCARLPKAFRDDHGRRWPAVGTGTDRAEAARLIHELTADRPHIVGAVPNFDTERLSRLLDRHDSRWGGHYHLIDVETLAVGYLHGTGFGEDPTFTLPWDSDALSRAVGVEPPGEGVRHTAMGDARWCRDIYDAVCGGAVR